MNPFKDNSFRNKSLHEKTPFRIKFFQEFEGIWAFRDSEGNFSEGIPTERILSYSQFKRFENVHMDLFPQKKTFSKLKYFRYFYN